MYKHLAVLGFLGISSAATAAMNSTTHCEPTPPATCYPDDCKNCYCLGPENYMVNAPVCPKTCDGDFIVKVAGFYWNAHQDGMEFAINNEVINPLTESLPDTTAIQRLNNLVDADYKTPEFKWDFGFKIGLGYCTTCDGWDFGVTWTWYRGKAHSTVEAELDCNQTLLPIWSAFAPANGGPLFATEIEADWRFRLNLIDITLGRQYWTSKYLSLRPHMGLRIAYLKQDYDLQHKGGSWSQYMAQTGVAAQDAFNNQVDMSNDYHGVGVRAGLDSEWNLGCGWAIFGNWAASIVYGRFSVDQKEENRTVLSPHDKTRIMETSNSFRASRAMLDLVLGIQWSSMFCDCAYGFTGSIGWEHHLFFNQNQLWRVNRIGDESVGFVNGFNNSGENVFHQRRGNLDTQGWTLTVKFEF